MEHTKEPWAAEAELAEARREEAEAHDFWRNKAMALAEELSAIRAASSEPGYRTSAMHAAVRNVLKHHNLIAKDNPGDAVVEADLIYVVLKSAAPPAAEKDAAELAAWRERFPQYVYRPQDDCVSLKEHGK